MCGVANVSEREKELLATIATLERRLASLRRSRQTLLRLLLLREQAESLRRLWQRRLAEPGSERVIRLHPTSLPPGRKS